MPKTLRPGLTLIEMLVVLVILAILTTLAVTLTGSTIDQARFDVTQRQLQTIKDAMIGPVGQPDAPSFVADMGRLPQGYVDPNDSAMELQLAELWSNPSPNPNNVGSTAMPTFGPYSALDPVLSTSTTTVYVDQSVTVLSGWRGPYVTLPPGQTKLRDGWGNPFGFLQTDGLTAVTTTGVSIGQVHSVGGPNAPYNLLQALPTSLVTISSTTPTSYWSGVQWSTTVTGSVTTSNPLVSLATAYPSGLTVLLFVPDVTKTTTNYVRVMTYRVTPANGFSFTFPVPTTDPNYALYMNGTAQPMLADSLIPVPIGPKAIRVYPYLPSASYWQGIATSGNGIVYLKVPAGGMSQTLYYP